MAAPSPFLPSAFPHLLSSPELDRSTKNCKRRLDGASAPPPENPITIPDAPPTTSCAQTPSSNPPNGSLWTSEKVRTLLHVQKTPPSFYYGLDDDNDMEQYADEFLQKINTSPPQDNISCPSATISKEELISLWRPWRKALIL